MLVIARMHPRLSLLMVLLCFAATLVVYDELETSRRQAHILSEEARNHFFWLRKGPEEQRVESPDGPFDKQRGYTRIPEWIDRLKAEDYKLTWQAGVSRSSAAASAAGLYPIYDAAPQAGLTIVGGDGTVLHEHRTPGEVFGEYEELPALLVDTLLFIENRELLESGYPYRNPALEWKRLAHATAAMVGRRAGATSDHFGGSTLATQLEKFRHSPGGVTVDEAEKMRQMATATLRAYQSGPRTTDRQRAIIIEYINGVPLAASPGYGEVQGLADGLRVWFGVEPKDVIYRLERLGKRSYHTGEIASEDARAFRMILSLFLAHRRPTYYLVAEPEDLSELTDAYARILARDGIIGPELRDAVLETDAPVLKRPPTSIRPDFSQRKAVDAVRASLLNILDVSDLYQLDRHDLYVQSTIDGSAQRRIDEKLHQVRSPEFLAANDLFGHRLLGREDPLEELIVSFTLFERTPQGNALRVLSDNHDQPLNINEHIKLDLGSTAKLRTLVSYLEIIANLYGELKEYSDVHLDETAQSAPDDLRRWTAQQLLFAPDISLQEIVDEAMEREYSANPDQTFFTGGGLHRFSNFAHRRNHTQPVSEAFRHSVNLVFIRMMHDIVDYYRWLDPDYMEDVLGPKDTEERHYLLTRFADEEGRVFQRGFLNKYADLDPEAIPAAIVGDRTLSSESLAMVAMVFKDQTVDGLRDFVTEQGTSAPSEEALSRWWTAYHPDQLSWQDRGHLTRIHPLELWTAAWLYAHPDGTRSEAVVASRQVRQDVYQWLFRTNSRSRQDQRIRTMVEAEAFKQLHYSWQRMGYPFEELVSSLATSIGSSADRPVALAELVGIIVNDGMREPEYRVDAIIAAAKTPYETRMERQPSAPKRVMPKEVARTLKRALVSVVEDGTASRIRGDFEDSNKNPILIGGKTGTGDHDHKVFDGFRLVSSRPVHRTATFAFFLGERFFGTVTVFVSGEPAGDFRFTSALPSSLLRTLFPALLPMLESNGDGDDSYRTTDPGGLLTVAAYGGTAGQMQQAIEHSRAGDTVRDATDGPGGAWESVFEPALIPVLDFQNRSPQEHRPRLRWEEILEPELPPTPVKDPELASAL